MIYIFRTSVKTEKDIQKLMPYLNELLLQAKWSFDLDDCDKILRIDSLNEVSKAVTKLMHITGFECEELH